MPSRKRFRRTHSRITIARAASDIGIFDAKLIERAFEPCQVQALIDDAAAPHLAHFIDAIGELVAAILDVDGGRPLQQIAAVHIGNARHQPSVYAKRFKFAVQG